MPPGDLFNEALSEVLRTVGQAAQLAQWIQRRARRALEKPDRTPLTVADLAVQVLVAATLERTYPDDPLVAEEDASAVSGETGREFADQVRRFVRPFLPGIAAADLARLLNRGSGAPGPRFWTLDPVDGTEGFVRGGHYAVALALVENGKPTVAMLGCPTLDPERLGGVTHGRDYGHEPGALLLAIRGRGTWLTATDAAEFTPVRVSDVREPRAARMLRSFAASHIDVAATEELIKAAGIAPEPVLMDGQVKHAMLAAGQADLFVRIPAQRDYREHIWDQAAGALVIEEAGGRITDIDGRPLDFSMGRRLEHNQGILAANPHLHPLIASVLRAQRGDWHS